MGFYFDIPAQEINYTLQEADTAAEGFSGVTHVRLDVSSTGDNQLDSIWERTQLYRISLNFIIFDSIVPDLYGELLACIHQTGYSNESCSECWRSFIF